MLKHLDPVFVVFEYHANGGPIDALGKILEFSGQYGGHLNALTQIASICCHHKYPTILFLAKYLPDPQSRCEVQFHRAQATTDEMVLPSRLADSGRTQPED